MARSNSKPMFPKPVPGSLATPYRVSPAWERSSDENAGHCPFVGETRRDPRRWPIVPDQLAAFAMLFAAAVGVIVTVKVPSSWICRSRVPSTG